MDGTENRPDFAVVTGISTGALQKIESWLGKLDDRLKKWLISRLEQEQW